MLALLGSLINLSSCKKADNEKIIVLDSKIKPAANEMALSRLELKKDVYPLDWIDDENLLVRRPNPNKTKITVEGGEKKYPLNVYSYNINNDTAKLLIESNSDITYALLSPDKKYIFYQQGAEGICQDFIYHLDTQKNVSLSNAGSTYQGLGYWVTEKELLVASQEHNTVSISDVNGNLSTLSNLNDNSLINVYNLDNKLLYSSYSNNALSILNLKDKTTIPFRKNVTRFAISNDKRNLALLNNLPGGKTSISIAETDDLTGKNDKILYESSNILAASWCPDNTKLAFTAVDPGTQLTGLFLTDAIRYKPIQIAAELKNTFDSMMWSPSGKILAIAAFEETNGTFSNAAYIIKLK